jgi:hypothetical protein
MSCAPPVVTMLEVPVCPPVLARGPGYLRQEVERDDALGSKTPNLSYNRASCEEQPARRAFL